MTKTQTKLSNNTPEPPRQSKQKGGVFNADLKEWVSQLNKKEKKILVKQNAKPQNSNYDIPPVQDYDNTPIQLNESMYSQNKHTLNIDSASKDNASVSPGLGNEILIKKPNLNNTERAGLTDTFKDFKEDAKH